MPNGVQIEQKRKRVLQSALLLAERALLLGVGETKNLQEGVHFRRFEATWAEASANDRGLNSRWCESDDQWSLGALANQGGTNLVLYPFAVPIAAQKT